MLVRTDRARTRTRGKDARKEGTRTRGKDARKEGTRTRQAVPINPRIRQRRVEVTRQEGRHRLRILIGVVWTALAAVFALFVFHSSLLSVKHLEVTGNSHEPEGLVAQVAGIRIGATPMIDADPASIARRLDSLPWIASATVVRHWPWTMSIEVVERTPVAKVAGKAGVTELVDATGRVLGPAGGERLPVMNGFTAPVPGRRLRSSARPALTVAGSLPSSLEPNAAAPNSGVTGITVLPGSEVKLTWGSTLQVLLGPPIELGAKYDALATLVTEADLKGMTRVDLTLPSQPTASP